MHLKKGLEQISRFCKEFIEKQNQQFQPKGKEKEKEKLISEQILRQLPPPYMMMFTMSRGHWAQKPIEEIEIRKTRGETITSKVKWKQLEDRCSEEFSKQ